MPIKGRTSVGAQVGFKPKEMLKFLNIKKMSVSSRKTNHWRYRQSKGRRLFFYGPQCLISNSAFRLDAQKRCYWTPNLRRQSL